VIALIRRVWSSDRHDRVTVIAKDQETGREHMCFVWKTTAKGKWIAAACERAESNGHPESKIPIVLTLKPPTRWGLEIEEAELLPVKVSA
jgi:hypothetical protein